jgi:hypothetical protein
MTEIEAAVPELPAASTVIELVSACFSQFRFDL